MARYRGICGLEAGDFSGLSAVGLTSTSDLINSAVAARSGNYYLDCNVAVAVAGRGVTIADSFADPGSGEYFDFRHRFYFNVVTLPSSSGLWIGGLNSVCVLQMDTTGHLRLYHYGTTTSYSAGAITTNTWYRVECRAYGLWTTATKTNSGRYRSTIDVYDDTGILLSSLASDPQVGLAAGLSCTSFIKRASDAALSSAFATVAARTTDYGIVITGSSLPAGNGLYDTVVSEAFMEGAVCGGSLGTGSVYTEDGTLLGEALNNFTIIHNFSGRPTLMLGQSNSGVSCTRRVKYDDAVFDMRSGDDAEDNLATELPLGTHVQIYAVAAQGTFDQFAPAGAFANVAEIPLNGSAQVASSTLGNATTYTKPVLAAGVVYHLRVYMNALGTADHKILIGADEYTFAFTGSTAGANNITNKADKSYQDAPIDFTTFNAIQYGGKVGTAADTFTIRNVLMEALTDPGTFIEVDMPDTGPGAFGALTLGLDIGNKGVPINVPETWQLERFDIGPRIEESA